jgi:hypothetical protein
MILRYGALHRQPQVFQSMTGLRLSEFNTLWEEIVPLHDQAYSKHLEAQRQVRCQPARVRAAGGGPAFHLDARDQLLLSVIWLRQYPTHEVLGYLFGVSDSTVSRVIKLFLPLLEASGRDTMKMPDPGKKQRRTLDALLHETPQLAVLVDSFEQRVQRPHANANANADADANAKPKKDRFYSGKKKQHTLKSQVAVNEITGQIADVSCSVPGPTADLKLLKASRLLQRLPPGVGAIGDLAYLGMKYWHPEGLAATPRRKPRGKERPPEDVTYNRALARRRIRAEHSIGRLRRYQSLNQMDRHHRQKHTARVCAVAGLVNRQIQNRHPALFA